MLDSFVSGASIGVDSWSFDGVDVPELLNPRTNPIKLEERELSLFPTRVPVTGATSGRSAVGVNVMESGLLEDERKGVEVIFFTARESVFRLFVLDLGKVRRYPEIDSPTSDASSPCRKRSGRIPSRSPTKLSPAPFSSRKIVRSISRQAGAPTC